MFVKKPDDDQKDHKQMVILRDDEPNSKSLYVKIPLIEGNALLTHSLLSLMDSIPLAHERKTRIRGRQKTIQEVSEFAVDIVADKLLQVSHPTFLTYLQNPSSFFQRAGDILETVNTVFQTLRTSYENFLRTAPMGFSVRMPQKEMTLEEVIATPDTLERDAKRFSQIDFNTCTQNPDDLSPENRREKDYFAARAKLLTLLYDTMKTLATNPDASEKEALAKKAIMDAVALKTTLTDLQRSPTARRLRHDKDKDNEYYIGRQAGFGRFHFEREITPQSTMDGVVGVSFDRAKQHLEEVIRTGIYPKLLRATAPGGKLKSNILLIGPYGCGKTELARAVCADPRVIGASVSVASTLTAWMHESVNNVKRVYDAAKQLRMDGNETKPVILTFDEFDGWFAGSNRGSFADTDMQQIENVLLEVLDGMEDYNGIITMAMTNNPDAIPKGILRRFRYVDIVGQLTEAERVTLLRQYLEKSLPMHPDVEQHYVRWAQKLEDAPGDVLRKVADEIHFTLLPEYVRAHPEKAASLERMLARRERQDGTLSPRNYQFLKARIGAYRQITPADIDQSIDLLLNQPQIRLQIATAKKVYDAAATLINDLSATSPGFGLRRKSPLFDRD